MIDFDKLEAMSPFVPYDTDDDNPPAWATSWTDTANAQTPDSVPKKWYNIQTGEFELPAVEVKQDNGWSDVINRLTDTPKKRSYIGGTPSEARDTFWKQDKVMSDAVDSIADRYGISSAALKNRLNHEGFVDNAIRRLNGEDKYHPAQSGKNLLYSDKYDGFGHFGTDDVGSFIKNGDVKLINENWYSDDAENEYGRPTVYANGATVADNIGIVAATLAAFKKEAKEKYPNFTDHQAEVYANIRYNRGKTGASNYFKKKGFGEYDFKEYSIGGPLVDAAKRYYEEGGPFKGSLWSNNNNRISITPNEEGVYKIPFYEDTPGFREHDYDEKVPDDILTESLRGKGYTYGDMYAVWNKQTRDELNRQGYNTGKLTTDEQRRTMGLPVNKSGNVTGAGPVFDDMLGEGMHTLFSPVGEAVKTVTGLGTYIPYYGTWHKPAEKYNEVVGDLTNKAFSTLMPTNYFDLGSVGYEGESALKLPWKPNSHNVQNPATWDLIGTFGIAPVTKALGAAGKTIRNADYTAARLGNQAARNYLLGKELMKDADTAFGHNDKYIERTPYNPEHMDNIDFSSFDYTDPIMSDMSRPIIKISDEDVLNRKLFSTKKYGPDPIYTREQANRAIKNRKLGNKDITYYVENVGEGVPETTAQIARRRLSEWKNAEHGLIMETAADMDYSTASFPQSFKFAANRHINGEGTMYHVAKPFDRTVNGELNLEGVKKPGYIFLNRQGDKVGMTHTPEYVNNINVLIKDINQKTGLNFPEAFYEEERMLPSGARILPKIYVPSFGLMKHSFGGFLP